MTGLQSAARFQQKPRTWSIACLRGWPRASGKSIHAAHGYGRFVGGAGQHGAQEMDCPRNRCGRARRAAHGAVCRTGSEGRLPTLTEKQQAILAELAACDGELPLKELRRRELPSSTLANTGAARAGSDRRAA